MRYFHIKNNQLIILYISPNLTLYQTTKYRPGRNCTHLQTRNSLLLKWWFLYLIWEKKDIVGKGGNAGYQDFLQFSAMFSKGFLYRVGKSCDVWYVHYILLQKNILFNPFPHNNTFLRPWETSLLKTLCEKEKLLVTSYFSISHVFSTRLDNFLSFSSNMKLSSANSFNLEESKICCLLMG